MQAVIIAAGGEHEVIDKIIRGEPAGTAFFHIDNCDLPEDSTASGGAESESDAGGMSRDTSFEAGSNGHNVEAVAATARGSGKDKTKISTITVEEIATRARDGSRQLNQVSESLRQDILKDIARNLQLRQSEILDANAIDVEAAEKRSIFILFLSV